MQQVRSQSICGRMSLSVLIAILGIPAAGQLTVAASDSEPDAGTQRPNIVLLLADDLGYGELGCQGNPQIPTPHIDSIARDGVRFTDGYVTAPFCAASRAGLMSGRYQTRFGFELNPIGDKNEVPGIGLPRSETTLAELLKDAGYTTGLIGKWHLGGSAEFHPFRHGFDEFFGFMHEGHYFVPPPYRKVTTMLRRRRLPDGGLGRWTSRNGRMIYTTHMGYNEPAYDADNPIYRGGQPIDERRHLTDAFTAEAVDFIDRNQDRPFFLYVAYNAVHSPLQGADAYMQKFAAIDDIHRRIFASMLAHLDDSVGSILSRLETTQLDRQTLVIFLSDNGGPTRELTSSNLPLRGEKGRVYEGGLRVPFLIKWPGRIPAGRIHSQPVISLDLYPTIAAAAGIENSAVERSDGTNLLPQLQPGADTAAPERTLFWRVGNRRALRIGDWKILQQPSRGQPAAWELYNLKTDLAETTNRAASDRERLERIVEVYEQQNAEMIDPLW